jgi:hypothetical protein
VAAAGARYSARPLSHARPALADDCARAVERAGEARPRGGAARRRRRRRARRHLRLHLALEEVLRAFHKRHGQPRQRRRRGDAAQRHLLAAVGGQRLEPRKHGKLHGVVQPVAHQRRAHAAVQPAQPVLGHRRAQRSQHRRVRGGLQLHQHFQRVKRVADDAQGHARGKSRREVRGHAASVWCEAGRVAARWLRAWAPGAVAETALSKL